MWKCGHTFYMYLSHVMTYFNSNPSILTTKSFKDSSMPAMHLKINCDRHPFAMSSIQIVSMKKCEFSSLNFFDRPKTKKKIKQKKFEKSTRFSRESNTRTSEWRIDVISRRFVFHSLQSNMFYVSIFIRIWLFKSVLLCALLHFYDVILLFHIYQRHKTPETGTTTNSTADNNTARNPTAKQRKRKTNKDEGKWRKSSTMSKWKERKHKMLKIMCQSDYSVGCSFRFWFWFLCL